MRSFQFLIRHRLIFGVALVALFSGLSSSSAEASKIARFDTVLGTFDVELLESVAPLHVANFIDNYANPGLYDGSFIHRATDLGSTGLEVVQGGGFTFNFSTNQIETVPSLGTVNNEFNAAYGNVRGTLALARPPSGIDSGSNQWFFNTVDNSAALDPQSFTVFGVVLGNGMDILDDIAALPTFNATIFNSAFGELPLRNNGTNAMNGLSGLGQDLVIINSITIFDADTPAVPEPGAIVLGLTALAGFGVVAYRRRKSAVSPS